MRKGNVVFFIALIGIAALLSAQIIFLDRNTHQDLQEISVQNTDAPTSTKETFQKDGALVSTDESEDDNKAYTTGQKDEPLTVNSNSDPLEANDTTDNADLYAQDQEKHDDEIDTAEESEIEVQNTQKSVTKITPEPLIVEAKYESIAADALLADKIVSYTNIERTERGLQTLEQNELLDKAATAKINDMFDKQYFEHVSPNGDDVVHWVEEVSYKFLSVGENLALGNFNSEEAMVKAWMESQGHRENILRPSYEEIGVAVGYGPYDGSNVWMGVQIFATPRSSCPFVDDLLLTSIDVVQERIDLLESKIDVLYLEISDTTTFESEEEYNAYLENVASYNKLVGQHEKAVSGLRSMIDLYNDQVRDYNNCISSMQ